MLPNLLTAKDIKKYLGIGNETLYNLLNERDFPAFRISGGEYRILEDEFIDWMRKNCKKSPRH